jgi:hypothetical protein
MVWPGREKGKERMKVNLLVGTEGDKRREGEV